MPNLRRSAVLLAGIVTMSFSTVSAVQAAVPPTIGLFTDYGWDDPYVAQLKGIIVTIAPNARLLDLTHSVAPFNIAEGSYLLDQCAAEFPAGTIFVAVVDPGVGTDRDPILVETNKQKFYVGPDNGLFTLVVQREGLQRAWKLDRPEFFRNGGETSRTFHGRDIFGPVAAHLAAGTDPDRLGTPMKTLELAPAREATFASGLIETQVLHIDHFGNVLLSLRAGTEAAAHLKEGTLIKIAIGRESFSAPLVKTYGDVDKGRLLLVFGGSGQLEVGMNQGSAARKMNVEPGTTLYLKP